MKVIAVISDKIRYVEEVKYAIELIFGDILGYEISFSISPMDISIAKILIGKYHFIFNVFLHTNDDIYTITSKNFSLFEYSISDLLINNKHLYNSKETLLELDFGSFKGEKYIYITQNTFETNFDFLGTAFFIASRFEEYIIKSRDKHNRFRYIDSILSKNDYILRPIVNEYSFFFKTILQLYSSKEQIDSLPKVDDVIPTHDVDFPFLFYKQYKTKFLKEIYSVFLKKGILYSLKYFFYGLRVMLFGKKDPYDYHREIIEINNSLSRTAIFNFMAGLKKAGNDGYYDLSQKKIQNLISEIIDSGHKIGFHPSYNTISDSNLFIKEISHIRIAISRLNAKVEVSEGRQHYLRFDINNTFDMWDSVQLKFDSTLGFAEFPGFRTGICCTHSVFSISKRKMISLKERPLALMDVTITSPNYLGLKLEDAYSLVDKLKLVVKKYNGQFVVLFHNDWFYHDTDKRFDFYKYTIS